MDNQNVEIPRTVASFDDDTFKRICNELGRQDVIDHPNRTTALDLRIRAGELVEVTYVEEDKE